MTLNSLDSYIICPLTDEQAMNAVDLDEGSEMSISGKIYDVDYMLQSLTDNNPLLIVKSCKVTDIAKKIEKELEIISKHQFTNDKNENSLFCKKFSAKSQIECFNLSRIYIVFKDKELLSTITFGNDKNENIRFCEKKMLSTIGLDKCLKNSEAHHIKLDEESLSRVTFGSDKNENKKFCEKKMITQYGKSKCISKNKEH